MDAGEEELAAAAADSNMPRRQAANDATPRTLYVRRDVLNAAEIIAHFKAQGFETTLPTEDMHVTIAFSLAKLDWMKVGEAWEEEIKIPVGGPRLMERFGDATVLLVSSRSLKSRHQDIREAGASWDHPEYQPHVTISYGFTGDLADVEPWQGEIVLGPEIFEELDENWRAGIVEDQRGAPVGDATFRGRQKS